MATWVEVRLAQPADALRYRGCGCGQHTVPLPPELEADYLRAGETADPIAAVRRKGRLRWRVGQAYVRHPRVGVSKAEAGEQGQLVAIQRMWLHDVPGSVVEALGVLSSASAGADPATDATVREALRRYWDAQGQRRGERWADNPRVYVLSFVGEPTAAPAGAPDE